MLYGCSGQANSGNISNAIESATFPINSTSIATRESSHPPFTVIPTSTGQPQTSKADLSIELTPTLDNGSSQKNLYTLTVRNLGPGLATDILITLVFPSGTNIDRINLLRSICQLRENQVICDVGDAPANSRLSFTLNLVSGTAEPEIQRSGLSSNPVPQLCSFEETTTQSPRLMCHLGSLKTGMQAQIDMELDPDIVFGTYKFSVAAAQVDPDLSNNAGSSAIALTLADPALRPDLTIQATGPAEVVAGQPFTYTYLITNQGTQPATEVKFDDPMPPGLRLHSYAPGLPLCEQKGNMLTCYLVDPDSGESITFTLTISGIEQQPVVMDVDPLVPGWPVCYVIKEQEPLHVLHCDLGTLPPGQSIHVRLEMLAIGVLERIATNTVAVEALEPDLAPADNTKSIDIAVQVQTDVLISADPPKWSAADKTLSYTIEVKNQGPSDADGSILTGALPSGTQPVSTNLDLGSECVVEAGNTLTCNLAYMKGGETTELNLVLNVPDDFTPQDAAEAFLHSLQVIPKALDPNPDNNIIVGPITINTGVPQ